jgi:uncharacterized membrane protein SpoIIM required for sporulation
MAASWVVVAREPSLAHRVLPGTALYEMEEMYSRNFEEGEREDAAMAGFYVRHNTSIAFQCFALGFFLGIGTIYVLLSNGIQLGTVAGYVIAQGHGERFLGFVGGHSSFELLAIVVSGAAGLVLGHAIIAPGARSRAEALKERGRVAMELALGAAAMLFVAAMIEGFWSAQRLPLGIKSTVAGALWVVVAAYLALAGRALSPPPAAVSLRAEASARARSERTLREEGRAKPIPEREALGLGRKRTDGRRRGTS